MLFHLLFALVLSQAVPQRDKPLSVCDVLADLQSYNGKMVTIRGIEGGGEGAFLIGENCRKHLVTKGYVWPDLIWITYPWSSLRPGSLHFQTDQHSVVVTDRAFKRAGFRDGDTAIVTITGLLETYDRLEDHVFSAPVAAQTHALGLGPDNIAPAQLIIREVADPEIRRSVTIRPPVE